MSDHDHQHHDHDHAHGHDHKNRAHPSGTGEIDLSRKKAEAPAPEPIPAPVEDAGSQALSEALRSSFVIVKIVMVILVIVFFASGVFTVSSQEKAIILRFGKPVGTGPEQLLGPGLHWSFPYPIDEVVRIPIGEIQTVTSTTGWYATTPEEEATNSEAEPGPSLNPAADGYTLTADGNIIHVRATLRYRISQPLDYLLNFVNASNVVQNALDNALFWASSRTTVDQALTLDKVGFQEKVIARVRDLVDRQNLGIVIEQAEVRTIPPRQVKNAFEQAFAADIERRKARDDARAYANRILSTAQGEATGIVNAGQTARTRLVQAIAAEAKYYQDQLPHYRNNKELFAQRLRTEFLSRILTNVEDKILIPERRDGKSREVRLQLSREPQNPVDPNQQAAQQQK
ncbi:MAG: protease modulator HflK [Verrucomicrobiota bacterium]|nr:protease modulator HflK [Verrucomicrobiota bacterium]